IVLPKEVSVTGVPHPVNNPNFYPLFRATPSKKPGGTKGSPEPAAPARLSLLAPRAREAVSTGGFVTDLAAAQRAAAAHSAAPGPGWPAAPGPASIPWAGSASRSR